MHPLVLHIIFTVVCLSFMPVASNSKALPAASEGREPHRALDSPQPDTLGYDDGQPERIWPGSNFYIRIEFQSSYVFELRSIYFYTTNYAQVTGTCSLFVHADNNGSLGDELISYTQESFAIADFNDTDLPQPLLFAEDERFFVVIGPFESSNQNVTFVPTMDTLATGHSAVSLDGRFGDYQTNLAGDWLLRVGGEISGYDDLEAVEVWNDVNGFDGDFHVLTGDQVQLLAEVANIGSENYDGFDVLWTIATPEGGDLFNEQESLGPLPADGVTQVNTSTLFTPSESGEYLATCVVSAIDDDVPDNNIAKLRFFAVDHPGWYRYDDNEEPEVIVPVNLDSIPGVSFTPKLFPATLDSLRIYFGGTGTEVVEVLLNGQWGRPEDQARSILVTPEIGWNTIALETPLDIFEGQSFTVALSTGDVPIGVDTSDPTSAAISRMDTIGWFRTGASWLPDHRGNWCIQAHLDTSSAIEPWPVIELSSEVLDFGEVPVSETSEMNLWVYNRGNIEDLEVSGYEILPPGIQDNYDIAPAELTIASGDSAQLTVAVTATEPNETLNGFFNVLSNAYEMESVRVTLLGFSGEPTNLTDQPTRPESYRLFSNYPNPFNPETSIAYSVPEAGLVTITVYDVTGRTVATLVNNVVTAGSHHVDFNAAGLASGIYMYRMEAGDFTATQKMVLMK